MRANEHTQSTLGWWGEAGVGQADLAVRRSSGAMIWHRDLSLRSLPLSWARAENVRGAEVYVRPARGYRWPVVFLDDVTAPKAVGIARKYDALLVQTSPAGGCHVWLSCSLALAEDTRRQVQGWLARRIEADPASTSGEHLGRLAGFRNWKRGGTWVNVLEARRGGGPWEPRVDEICRSRRAARAKQACGEAVQGSERADTSESGREWGWICGMLQAGDDPRLAYSRLVDRARPRRGDDAERYARRTVARALERVGHGGVTS